MPLTRDFHETIRARAQADPEFRKGLLLEAIDCILNGELAVSRSILRDLEQLAQNETDRQDIEEALAALKEAEAKGTITLEEARKRLGL